MDKNPELKELEFMNEEQGYINNLNGVYITDAGIGACFRSISQTHQIFCTKNTYLLRNTLNDPSIEEYKSMIQLIQEYVDNLEEKEIGA